MASDRRINVVRPVAAPFPWAEPLFTVGVTGTNGKTSTTHLVASIFRAAGRRTIRQSTLGYALDEESFDVPERTRKGFYAAMEHAVAAGATHAAIEVTSKALRGGYATLWRFDLGVFTNLTRDHLDEHGSWEDYLASKAQLFVHLGPGKTAVLNACDEAATLVHRVLPPDIRRLWYGAPWRGTPRHAPDLFARTVVESVAGTHLELEPSELADALGGELEIPLVGEAFAENALAAAAATIAADVEPRAIRSGLASCPPIPGRFEVLCRSPLVAIDYAHTPDALAHLAATARRVAGDERVLFVFGAGGSRDPTKREPMGQVVGACADIAIVTNDNPRQEDPAVIAQAVATGCRSAGRAQTRIIYDRTEAIAAALDEAGPRDVVVIAGRGRDRGMHFVTGTVDYSDVDAVRARLSS